MNSDILEKIIFIFMTLVMLFLIGFMSLIMFALWDDMTTHRTTRAKKMSDNIAICHDIQCNDGDWLISSK